MSAVSIPTQIRNFFDNNTGGFTTAHIAGAIGVSTKSASSAVSRLIKSGHLLRLEDGRIIRSTPIDEDAEPPTEELPDEPETAEEPAQAEPTTEFTEQAEEPVVVRTEADLAKLKSRIKKMLNLAERTTHEHERDAFNTKAEKLMVQLGIARAELESEGEVKAEEIIEVVREWRGNYSIALVPFVHEVCKGFGNLTVLQNNSSAMLRRTFIIGFKSDVEAALVLIDSLALQVMSALRLWQKAHAEERRGMTDMEKYVQHRSFIIGFGHTVGERLQSTRTVQTEQASTGAALVLASKTDQIGSWIGEAYPKMGKARGGMQYHSSTAMRAGRAAGNSANLGGTSVEGNLMTNQLEA